ncbi:electron transfer flavoprotein subunit beta/FixA family protein [Clostridium swellfunianum]|uniref:electron transfer flavoprotein subunit beta/FixA family protein n=1 Tax=Clostridium swellfunianum TaxID=1367462 RepID=UPI00202E572C|nr:electron transfer flavoprotein subunit beta/FixA family protein [Clostridium swellfunianum]MCM0649567.1 electron transfer flavoprotein subunit beta/FixA family protein [Clostridium swellfunianum]
MKIIVCIKQVPDTNEVKIDQKTGTLIREGVPSIINPDDKNALEQALSIKDKYDDVNVIVVTMGPPQAEVALIEALAMGADRAILLSDKTFAGADTLATSRTLAAAIKKLGNFDIILCGRQAIDGDTAQVGPQLAEHLGLAQATYVQRVEIEKDNLLVTRALEDGYEILALKTPCLLTAVKELNKPRYMRVKKIFEAYNEKTVEYWSVKDIDIDVVNIGLKGSPTNVWKSFTPSQKGKGIIYENADRETIEELVSKLREKYVL